jgi:uncharacterized Zn finger protein
MTMKTITIICDKCGSADIEKTIFHKETAEPEPIKMTEFEGISQVMTLEYRPTHWQLRCKNCGFIHNFIQ